MSVTHNPRILSPKLGPPVSRALSLRRRRLLDALLGARDYRVALVHGPAGAGKTTVLAQNHDVLSEAGEGAAWLSLDRYDDSPHRFMMALLAALARVDASLGEEAAEMLAVSPEAPVREALASLIDDCLRYGRPLTVTLDDYHELANPEVHAAVDFLLRYLPANLRLLIGSRDLPPLALARLRMRGELLELPWEELRFTADEVACYLRDNQSLVLDEAQLRRLGERSEGWIAGLQLAAVSLRDQADAQRFVDEFSGARAEVADYLLEDVFQRQEPALQEFLLRSAVLERISAPLCNAVLGIEDARRRLDQLEQANLFIFSLDAERQWYRFHHLFRDFLRARLQAGSPQARAQLLRRASQWYREREEFFDALAYAVEGGWYEQAAELLEAIGQSLVYGCRFKELREWLERLPADLLRRRARLALLYGWASAYLGAFEQAREAMAWAQAAAADDGAGQLLRDELQVLRTVTAIIQTDEPELAGGEEALPERFPVQERLTRAMAYIVKGYALRAGHRLECARQAAQAAIELSDDTQGSLVNLLARFNHGTVLYLQGRLKEAEQSLRASIDHAQTRRWGRSMALAFIRVQLAMVLQQWERWQAALGELDQAVELLESSQNYGFLGLAYAERSVCLRALNREEAADKDLGRAAKVATRHHVTRARLRHQLISARVQMEQGRTDASERILRDASVLPVSEGETLSEQQEGWLLGWLRLLQQRGDYPALAAQAARGEKSARTAGRGLNRVCFLLWQARAAERQNDEAAQRHYLDEALREATPGEIRLPFKGLPPEQLQRLTAQAVWLAPRPDSGPETDDSVPDLHPRELQILELLAEGLRNRAVAQRLFLSEETVKWYLKRLYQRLEVGTRTEAVARARQMQLIT
ncbi:LuxR C-terminal-related transcriptional regulator [Alkalilimnicola sp. S0819]|uniref:LuxR C-terminal-related transcriptional regulator n=1 Tax=Alkalilimnicola sp. S0819 TaxID=2613922 RepID=UPI0018699804|nr:LuxR C-terminal-related transcriptional regulator [Alkalilimnicola sp. S0819]